MTFAFGEVASVFSSFSFIPDLIDRRTMAEISVRARSIVTSGARRPMSNNQEKPRSLRSGPCGVISARIPSGIQRSACCPTTSPKNPAGVTPMIVSFTPLIVIGRPMTLLSAEKRRCQYPWLITATGAASVPRSSSSANVRPVNAWTPSTLKKLPETSRPRGCSGLLGADASPPMTASIDRALPIAYTPDKTRF